MQAPVFVGQRQGLPQHCLRQCRVEQADHAAAIGQHIFGAHAQRLQRAIGILPRRTHLVAFLRAERAQQAVAPCIAVGQEHHVVVVAGQHHVRAVQPFLFQRGQLDLDHDHADALAVGVQDGLGHEIAGHPGGHADAVETATAMGQCLLVVGAVAVILADVAGRLVPVAGGYGHAIAADQGQRRGAGDLVGALQFQVQALPLGGRGRHLQCMQQVRIQRHHLRQGAEPVDALLQPLAIQLQLALHLCAFRAQGATPGVVAGGDRAQHGAGHHHQNGQQLQAVAAEPVHGGSLRRAGGRGVHARRDLTRGRDQKCICARSSKISGVLCTPRRLASTFT
ncbi:hypothetical protein D3C81_400040 [compost metagenome]